MKAKSSSVSILGILVWITKLASIGLMVVAPALGVWMASSLAAFANKATWLPLAAGALLFPGLPLAWDLWSEARRDTQKRRFLTFLDRLVLRTLVLNGVFIAVILSVFPKQLFVALAARGDWFLEGGSGPTTERLRSVTHRVAVGFEWLHRATHANPFRKEDDSSAKREKPKPTESAEPAPKSGTDADAKRASTWPLKPELHPIVASMPSEAETSIEAVGRYIAEHEKDPRLRVKALHDWAADRIAYDAPALRLPQIPHEDGDPEWVFRSRKGVCAGYAMLLVELGKITGDEIVYVLGEARSYLDPMNGVPHAWNAAKIEGRWYLIDATWDAGSVDDAFKKAYGTDYLFTPPAVFASTHFPEKEDWQLADKPLDHAEFFRKPVLNPVLYARGVTLRTPDRAQVSSGALLDVAVDNPRDAFLMVTHEPARGGTPTDCRGDPYGRSVRCEFPSTGAFNVHLFVGTERYGRYEHGGAVQVNARR